MTKWIDLPDLLVRPREDGYLLGVGSSRCFGDLRATSAAFAARLPAASAAPWLLSFDSMFNMAAALLACWAKGIVPTLGLLPGDCAAAGCGGVLSDADCLPGEDHLRGVDGVNLAGICAGKGVGLRVRHGGEWRDILLGELAADLLALETACGALTAQRPRAAIGPLADYADLCLRLLWPLCAGAPFAEFGYPDWPELFADLGRQPLVLIARGRDFDRLPAATLESNVRWEWMAAFSVAEPMSATRRAELAQRMVVSPEHLGGGTSPRLAVPPRPDEKPLVFSRVTGENSIQLKMAAPAGGFFFNGHFRKAAVLAGVCQLVWIFDEISSFTGSTFQLGGLEAVKFHQLLFPNEVFQVLIERDPKRGKWHYQIHSDHGKIASGRLVPASDLEKT